MSTPATLNGTVVIINAKDRQFEAETLAELLRANNVNITLMSHIANTMLIPGRPYVRVYEDIAVQAKHFIVIPSTGLKNDYKIKELVYIALGLQDDNKRVLPVKFSPEDSGMPFLEVLAPARFYTTLEGKDKERYIQQQVRKLLEVL